MAIADLVYEQTKKLPEHLAREVLDGKNASPTAI